MRISGSVGALLISACIMGIGPAANAQGTGSQGVSSLSAAALGYTPAQVSQFKALNAAFRPRMRALIDSAQRLRRDSAFRASVPAKMQALQAAYDAQYRAILTAQQRTQLDAALAAERAKVLVGAP